MTDHWLGKGRGWGRAAQIACAFVAVVGAGSVGGCLNRPIEPNDPKRTSTIVEPFKHSGVDKIDLLLMLDNSRSMADKQLILQNAVPDLVGRLVNPRCVDATGMATGIAQPASPLEMCPAGTEREFKAVNNIHIGIVTSSLGGHGSDACATPAMGAACSDQVNPSNNDAGHLISRQAVCGGADFVTYQNSGFLAWDPGKVLMPPGEGAVGSVAYDAATATVKTVTPGIEASLKDLVAGVGQVGCGYEASLEAWYRFLVDPEPYASISVVNGNATPTGTDALLLKQRADFLRPSSLLAIIMLTDENDCSVKEFGQFYLATQQQSGPNKVFGLPRARTECATNPNDPCCKSCGQNPGACPVDPNPDCVAKKPLDTKTEDTLNLRCWDQKRRFGIDFLYPIDRYTNGLTSSVVPKRDGTMVKNPIFSDLNLNDDDSSIRDKGLVFIAGIVGVPWEDIARTRADGTPDLAAGLDADGNAVGGLKNAEELALKDPTTMLSPWDRILGDPANYVPPADPHMIESIAPRAGLAPPSSPAGTDPINGHEYTIAGNDDLQYACIFPLLAPRDCTPMGAAGSVVGCDCSSATNDNPLCDPTTKTQQIRAKGYPGIRELSVLRSVSGQGIVASVCPGPQTDQSQPDFGYRPAVGAIIDRLKTALAGKCLPRSLTIDKVNHTVPCLIISARATKGTPTCDPSKALLPVSQDHIQAIAAAKADPSAPTDANGKVTWNEFCEIKQVDDSQVKGSINACETVETMPVTIPNTTTPVNGWCYVDPGQNQGTGANIVKDCQPTEKRLIRFVGTADPPNDATLFITCSGQ